MEQAYLGIDISKAKFHVALRLAGAKSGNAPKQKVFNNDAAGGQALLKWLQQQGVSELWACLEATSTYGDLVAETLYQAGYRVSVVNPSRVRAFSKSELRRVKTDKADAQLILRFCIAQELDLWQPLAPEIKQFQELVRRLAALRDLKQQEQNRLETASAVLTTSLETMIESLEQEISRIEQLIQDHLDQHPHLRAQQQLLTSIPGIGAQTANVLLTEIPDWTIFKNPRQLVAYAGLNPEECSSGTSIQRKVRLSCKGNARLRQALYLPAVVAKQFNPILASFYERLLARGKAKMQVIGAVMRKLLHLAFGIMKSGKAFDPNHLKTAQATV